ncbi:uncharacterized protein LOC118762983 [Octopus sinensis]|uniref:Uncharacterized protein LOC118762983 n=1 Tax=Octopus sinensis TaxID=2607531 RepID=A0A7E6EQL2_9MOLL|nr:uncharacterized protein LOC118762983 [Octopus sinensis]
MPRKQFQAIFLFGGFLVSLLCITSWMGTSIENKLTLNKKHYDSGHHFEDFRRSLLMSNPSSTKNDFPTIQQCHFYNISNRNVCYVQIRCYQNDSWNFCLNISCHNCNHHYLEKKAAAFQYKILKEPKLRQDKLCQLLEDYYVSKKYNSSGQSIIRCMVCNQLDRKLKSTKQFNSISSKTNCKPVEKENRTTSNIHLIYFRFFSRQEFKSKFHQTHTQLMKINNENIAHVYNFAKHQSTRVQYSAGLYQLLCGETFDLNINEESLCSQSLAKTATKYGYQTFLFDHTCEESTSEKINFLFTKFYQGFDYNTKGSSPTFYNDLPPNLQEKTCHKSNSDKKVEISGSGIFDYHQIVNKESNGKYILLSILRTSDVANSQLRVIDSQLAKVIEDLSKQKDSVIILTGDIGHGWSVSGWNNSKITQLSNPPLYLVLSKQFQKKLGKIRAKNVLRNTHNLVTLKDIHFTLRDIMAINDPKSYLKDNKSSKDSIINETTFGLFQFLKKGRSCGFLDVMQPHICLTENQAVTFDNDSIQVGLAEFVLGEMNEKIQEEIETEENETDLFLLSPFGNCQRLKGLSFGNINKWRDNGKVMTQMDIHVIGKDTKEPNVLTVLLSTNDDSKNPNIQVLSYHRKIPSNDGLQICFRSKLDYDLCRCVETVNQSLSAWRSAYLRMVFSKSFGVPLKVANIHNQCLLLIMRDYTNSIVFEAVNICEGREYILGFYIDTYNMISLVPLPIKKTVKPLQVRFLTSIIQSSYLRPGRFTKYQTYFSVKMR